MKRMKYEVKREKPGPSTSYKLETQNHDLAYYIQDRVEMMHQVLSAIKPKELMEMAPECVSHLSISDLQELCLEELLGISSKRLCAILDGAEPPSDTESSNSSQDKMETISLDSISSDDEILSQGSSKRHKKHKHHKRRDSKTRHKSKKKRSSPEADAEQTKASRAGLTVLELLELQARARAIRAQLQKEQASKQTSETLVADESQQSSDNEVEIKEEPPEVLEISSDDEKPNVQDLMTEKQQLPTNKPENLTENSHSVTKRINDLIITVPQSKQSRKIKLNRNKVSITVEKGKTKNDISNETPEKLVSHKFRENSQVITKHTDETELSNSSLQNKTDAHTKSKGKKKLKKKEKKRQSIDNEGSDHDEICLQLSDTEKMDLLEDLGRKNYKNATPDSEDTESSSSDTETDTVVKPTESQQNKKTKNCEPSTSEDLSKKIELNENENNVIGFKSVSYGDKETKGPHTNEETVSLTEKSVPPAEIFDTVSDKNEESREHINEKDKSDYEIQTCDFPNRDKLINSEKTSEISTTIETSILKDGESNLTIEEHIKHTSNVSLEVNKNISKEQDDKRDSIESVSQAENISLNANEVFYTNENREKHSLSNFKDDNLKEQMDIAHANPEETNSISIQSKENLPKENTQNIIEGDKKSDGEVSDRESSEIEAIELQPEVVCISDDETENKKGHKKKKNKTKEKKPKKDKKHKKSKSDFREDADQNFYEEDDSVSRNVNVTSDNQEQECNLKSPSIVLDDENYIYEILELSDDSSCYEVEGVSVLSKEPTTEEIEALSAKIDEIERDDVVSDEQIRQHEKAEKEKEMEELQNISWKDRYLDSRKVKRVLTTASILNALRKKNKELKRKIEESKKEDETLVDIPNDRKEESPERLVEDGSIEQYNTLKGLTKYVDPVIDSSVSLDSNNINICYIKNDANEENKKFTETKSLEDKPSKEMTKDAKQLLKMYKRLLKYNDMNKQKEKKKKKKDKKHKNKQKNAENSQITNNATNP